MHFSLLGAMTLTGASGSVDVGPPKQRALLATLALQAGQTVSVHVLVDRIWEERPPADARKVLHSYITRARGVLARAAGPGSGTIARGPGGYRLDLDPDRVDVHRFRELLHRARAAEVAGPAREALLTEALTLWRDDPLGGVPGAWAETVRRNLRQQRLTAALDWADLRLAVDDHRSVLPVLESLAQDHPLAETLAARMMWALTQAGRRAEALALFAKVRHDIIEELGVEPDGELHDAHRRILGSDRGAAAPAAPDRRPPPAGPAQLPPDVRGFVGRDAELAALDRILAAAGRDPHALTIAALSGTAGVGKTALAIRWANRVAERFPDGQLFVDLRGYDPERPMSPAAALTGFLRALGVRNEAIPLDVHELAVRYRTVTAGRRMLVLLDNASSVEQLRPLLPGVATVCVLVTSRDSLPALVARHGASRVALDLLDGPGSLALLRELVGERVGDDPAAAAELLTLCAGLPLAVRIAAELVLAEPYKSLRVLVGELADRRERLVRLEAGADPRTAVTVVFSWSYDRLAAGVATVFRRLGLHPGPSFDAYAAAALTGADPDDAQRALDALARANLIQATAPQRYQMHDLLRAYAGGLAGSEEPAALAGLIRYYLARTAEAVDTAQGGDEAAAAEALAWLDADRANLVAVCGHAAEHGPFPAAIELAGLLWRHLDGGGYHAEAAALHSYARDAARRNGDVSAQARSVVSLGVVAWRQSDFARATALFDEGLRLARQIGDALNEARALTNLGLCNAAQGRYAAAVGHLEPALRTFLSIDHDLGAAGAHNNLAMIYIRQGRFAEATEGLRLSAKYSNRSGDRVGEACALTNLGLIATMLDDLPQAFELLGTAREMSQAAGDRRNEAHTVTNLGVATSMRGDHRAAMRLHERALALFRQAGDAEGEANTLLNMGVTWRAARDAGRAADALARALVVAEEHGASWEKAAVHVELGGLHQARGDLAEARRQWLLALDLYAEFGTPQADQVRTLLAGLAA